MDDPFWKPLFTTGNSYDGTNYIYKNDIAKRVIYNGDMTWDAAENLEVTCEADVSKYPFDTHQCFLLLLLLGYLDSEISVSPSGDHVLTD